MITDGIERLENTWSALSSAMNHPFEPPVRTGLPKKLEVTKLTIRARSLEKDIHPLEIGKVEFCKMIDYA